MGFLVHNKAHRDNVLEISSVSTRVAYLVIRLTERHPLQIIQAYAPTSTGHLDDVVEAMHEGMYPKPCIVKPNPKKGSWLSPDCRTKNEIDFIMTDKKHIFRDISVVNRFNTGSDHRLMRGTLNINYVFERSRMMRSVLRPTLDQTGQGSKAFHLELRNRFTAVETTDDVDKDLESVIEVIREVRNRQFKWKAACHRSKLSSETLELMKQRREMPEESLSDTGSLHKKIRSLVRQPS